MISLIKLLFLIIIIATAAYFVMPIFGYELNLNYFTESRDTCQQRLNDCTKQYIEQGTKNAKCEVNCVDPSLIIKQKQQ